VSRSDDKTVNVSLVAGHTCPCSAARNAAARAGARERAPAVAAQVISFSAAALSSGAAGEPRMTADGHVTESPDITVKVVNLGVFFSMRVGDMLAILTRNIVRGRTRIRRLQGRGGRGDYRSDQSRARRIAGRPVPA
jgi:hypothetical protein